MSYRFHLAHCTLRHELEQKQTVFVSQPESHRVIRIKNVLDKKAFMPMGSLDDISDVEANWEPFIGNGQRCLPGESDNCGDGGKAKDARLSYPKGMINMHSLSSRKITLMTTIRFNLIRDFYF